MQFCLHMSTSILARNSAPKVNNHYHDITLLSAKFSIDKHHVILLQIFIYFNSLDLNCLHMLNNDLFVFQEKPATKMHRNQCDARSMLIPLDANCSGKADA